MIMTERFMYRADQIDSVVQRLYELVGSCKVIAFMGPLGAGKTTLAKKLLRRCGVQEVITSPTYTYVNKYENGKGDFFYHFDLYRVGSVEEFLELGLQDFVYSDNGLALIEWPEVVLSLLDHDLCKVTLDYGTMPDERLCAIEMSKGG